MQPIETLILDPFERRKRNLSEEGLDIQVKNHRHITIDGPVGAGKSTLMQMLVDEGYTAFPEPVAHYSLLEMFYADRARYSFPLQIDLLNKRFDHLRQLETVERAVTDRSIYCDEIFARMLFSNGELSKEELQIYEDLRLNMLEHCAPPTLLIYLEISIDTAVERIVKRNRAFELQTERRYWEDLNHNYRQYFLTYAHSPLLRINVDELDFEANARDQSVVLELINAKLDEIQNAQRLVTFAGGSRL